MSPETPAPAEIVAAEPALVEVTTCAMCGRGGFSPYEPAMYELDSTSLDLRRCRGCGFVFVSPRPSASRLKALYADEAYYETDYTLGVSGSSYFARREELLVRYDRVVAELEQTERPGRILEVGAAGGFFLEAARRRGWTPLGVEISPFAADYARREFGIEVQTGDVSEAVIAPSSQDVVYVDNILEHTIDPIAVLRRLHGIVRPGGLLVVIVPTYVNSIYFQLFKVLRSSPLGRGLRHTSLGRILKLRRDELSPPYHIDEFSTRVVRNAILTVGFTVERLTRSVPIPDYLEAAHPSLGLRLQRAAFRAADRLMRSNLLPGARVELWARKRLEPDGGPGA